MFLRTITMQLLCRYLHFLGSKTMLTISEFTSMCSIKTAKHIEHQNNMTEITLLTTILNFHILNPKRKKKRKYSHVILYSWMIYPYLFGRGGIIKNFLIAFTNEPFLILLIVYFTIYFNDS